MEVSFVELARGDIVTVSLAGDYGKPRPALVVQTNRVNATHESVVVCPVTSTLVDAPLFRIRLRPSTENGLKVASEVMVDKVTTVHRRRIGKRIGQLEAGRMADIDQALRQWLGLDA